jgi:hypothetical protein
MAAGIAIQVALAEVKRMVTAVGKNERNAQQGFNYRGVDAVVNAAAPALNEVGVITVPELIDYTYEVVEVGKNKTPMAHVMGRVKYSFLGPAGDAISATVLSESMDSGDKAAAKMMSVAYRIALLQVLNLPTDEPDPDSVSYERAAKPDLQEMVITAAAITDTGELRKHWEKVGAAGLLTKEIAHPQTGEKLSFQDYLTAHGAELALKSSASSAPANTRTRAGAAK